MGHDVQSQAGVSLSDVYDIKGGQAPIERLLTTEVPVVHEMGTTIQAERFSSTIRRRATGDIGQNTNFDSVIDDLPSGITRILGLAVLVDALRISVLTVSQRDVAGGREIPIFVWASGNATSGVRLVQEGAPPANTNLLIPALASPISMIVGTDQPQSVDALAIRGTTTGFGAGTVEAVLLVHIAFAAIGGISSRGLPVPSW